MIPAGFTKEQWRGVCDEALGLLQQLLRIDTSNPPGNEAAAAELLAASLREDGIESEILEAEPGRSNLICRLPARAESQRTLRNAQSRVTTREASRAPEGSVRTTTNDASRLLLTGHLDVVPAGNLRLWRHPPFGGVIADGMIWGRGTLDMKNMVAMAAMVVKLLARRKVPLRREVIFCAVADEEEGGTLGSQFLVEKHPEKVRADFAVGESGGMPLEAGGVRFIGVQVAEKGLARMRLTARGPSGHGSVPRPQSAPIIIGRAISRLRHPLPYHCTEEMALFIRRLAALLPAPQRWALSALANPWLGHNLTRLLGDKTRLLSSLLRNTVSPTVLSAGQRINVIPAEATVELDGRVLPGQTIEDIVREVRAQLGSELSDQISIEVLQEAHGVSGRSEGSELWHCIEQILKQHTDLPVLPTMLPGFTDGHHFSRLGALWHGFAPVWWDADSGLKAEELFHAENERIPVSGFEWGLGLLLEVVWRFCAIAES